MNLPNGSLLEVICENDTLPLTRLSPNFYAMVNKRQFTWEKPWMEVPFSFLSFEHGILLKWYREASQ